MIRGFVAASSLAVAVVVAACGDGGGGSSSSGAASGGGCGGSSDGVSQRGGFLGQQSVAGRSYALFVPDDYDGSKAYPVVVVLHGDGGTGASIRTSFGLEAETKNAAIVVYPDGASKTWQIDGKDKLGADIAFVDAVIGDVQGRFCADASRTFVVGFSKGAYFANQYACRAKTPLKGVVTHAGGGPFGVDASEFSNGDLKCPAPAIAALQVQGESDTTVPPSEGEKARDHWSAANGCSKGTKAYDPSPCLAFEGCARPEVYCAIPGLGHGIWKENGSRVTWAFLSSL